MKMPGFLSKITHHRKTHDEFKLSEKRQSRDANTKRAGRLELCDKD